MNKRAANFDAVCFDFDSTLTRLEGIDELARRAGVAGDIAPLTEAAMDGRIPLDEVYGKRLDIVGPTRNDIDWLAERYIAEMTDGVDDTLGMLLRDGVGVYIVSGGLRPAILPFAERCGIDRDHVAAVNIDFDSAGRYRGYDHLSPLTKPDGKADICAALRRKHPRLALVGDGVTDVSARQAGAFVIGFGGVVARTPVRDHADVFVATPSLTGILPVIFNDAA